GALALAIGLVVGAFGPVAFFFALAHMLARAQELRTISQSMAEVAMRLVEPESLAPASIVNVGQAVRCQVVALCGGGARAAARAGGPGARDTSGAPAWGRL